MQGEGAQAVLAGGARMGIGIGLEETPHDHPPGLTSQGPWDQLQEQPVVCGGHCGAASPAMEQQQGRLLVGLEDTGHSN